MSSFRDAIERVIDAKCDFLFAGLVVLFFSLPFCFLNVFMNKVLIMKPKKIGQKKVFVDLFGNVLV